MKTTDLDFVLGPSQLIPPGEGRNFEIAGERIAVFRTRRGEVFATQAKCPHKNGLLADGLVGDGSVVCPLHAWKFDLTTGEALTGSCKLTTYPVSVTDDGVIVVTIRVPETSEVII
ncbi:MAG: Rieske (2Fe-2S) protein [Bryobacteraceae bacterium]